MRVFKLWDVDEWDVRDVPQPRLVEGTEDITEILGPGVYVLWLGGRWVHADWAKNVMERIVVHRQLISERVPTWMPLKGYRFDRVTWKRCPKHKAEITLRQLKEALRGEPALS